VKHQPFKWLASAKSLFRAIFSKSNIIREMFQCYIYIKQIIFIDSVSNHCIVRHKLAMRTVTYLKTSLISRAELERRLEAARLDYSKGRIEARKDLFTRLLLKLRGQFVRLQRAQTITDYALILAAIAIMGFGIYKSLRHKTVGLASSVDSTLINR
jgi:hypothetical protein